MDIETFARAVIGLMGIVIIIYGAFSTFGELIRLEVKRIKGAEVYFDREKARHHLGAYLLFGLEFLIGADIIRTIAQPKLVDLAVLAGIVAIRTTLSYFLRREIAMKA